MISVLTTISVVFGYILIGYVLKKVGIIPLQIEKIFSNLSFNVLLPLALITNFWLITFLTVSVLIPISLTEVLTFQLLR